MFRWGRTILEKTHSLIFSSSSTTPCQNIKWQVLLVGKGLEEDLCGAKEEDQSCTSFDIIELVVSLLSGDICELVCYGSILDAGRKAYMLPF